jgi:hypothetical protein
MNMRQENRTGRRGTRSRALIAGGVIALAGTVAACGSTASGATGSTPSKPKVSLNITVEKGPGHAARHWTLQCDPAGGTHPNPEAACRALLAVKHPFSPPKPGHMCPMILASAQRAIFNGTWYGQKVHRTIIDGGCDLGHWSKLGQVVN